MTIQRLNIRSNCDSQEARDIRSGRFMSERMVESVTQSLRAEGYGVSKDEVRKVTRDYIRSP